MGKAEFVKESDREVDDKHTLQYDTQLVNKTLGTINLKKYDNLHSLRVSEMFFLELQLCFGYGNKNWTETL